MYGCHASPFGDLVSATEPAGNYLSIRFTVADRREKPVFANLHRKIVMFFLMAE